jgi:fumarate hydratase class II
MPGKVNPSQAEALMMVCVQVMGADVTVQMAGAEGSLELNTFRPLVIATYLESAQLLADACASFTAHMIDGAQLNLRRVREHVDNSVMLVTALAPVIGYDRAADIAKLAVTEDLTLREAALVHEVPAEQFDELVDPAALTRGNAS